MDSQMLMQAPGSPTKVRPSALGLTKAQSIMSSVSGMGKLNLGRQHSKFSTQGSNVNMSAMSNAQV